MQVDHDILKACNHRPLSSSETATEPGHKTLSGNLRKELTQTLQLQDFFGTNEKAVKWHPCRNTLVASKLTGP